MLSTMESMLSFMGLWGFDGGWDWGGLRGDEVTLCGGNCLLLGWVFRLGRGQRSIWNLWNKTILLGNCIPFPNHE